MYWIAIKDNEATIVSFKKLTRGIAPNLPKYKFIGASKENGFDTKSQAKSAIPVGVTFEGEVVGVRKHSAPNKKHKINSGDKANG